MCCLYRFGETRCKIDWCILMRAELARLVTPTALRWERRFVRSRLHRAAKRRTIWNFTCSSIDRRSRSSVCLRSKYRRLLRLPFYRYFVFIVSAVITCHLDRLVSHSLLLLKISSNRELFMLCEWYIKTMVDGSVDDFSHELDTSIPHDDRNRKWLFSLNPNIFI